MDKEQARNLLIRYTAGKCSEQEKAIVEQWYFQSEENPIDIPDKRIEEIGKEILENIPLKAKAPVKKKLWTAIIGAAAVGLLAIASLQLLTKQNPVPKDHLVYHLPGGTNRAIITLSNGKKIILDSNQSTIIVSPEKLTYANGSKIDQRTMKGVQTIATPRGGEYQIVLPDGTKVWLNAASSLSYPSKFPNTEREVMLTGEAYFEVAHDSSKPFLVHTKDQTVRVLGTHFNINSYADEPSSITTLAQGSVQVNTNQPPSEKTNGLILSPGERSVVSSSGMIKEKADLETALAWKDGTMEFRDQDLQAILREVSRWYNIDIVYPGKVPQRIFSGSVSRRSDLTALLKILKLSNIHYRVQGNPNGQKQLVILP